MMPGKLREVDGSRVRLWVTPTWSGLPLEASASTGADYWHKRVGVSDAPVDGASACLG
jgi:hypothetical protein